MPYKDPLIRKQKSAERKKAWQDRQRQKRIDAGLPADGRGKHNAHSKGKTHYRWNNGKIVDSEGYPLIRAGKTHPLADSNGYVREHVLVLLSASRLIALPPKTVVHHLNGDKMDNRTENLLVMERSEHNKEHNENKIRDPRTGRFLGKKTAGRKLDGQIWNQFPGGNE